MLRFLLILLALLVSCSEDENEVLFSTENLSGKWRIIEFYRSGQLQDSYNVVFSSFPTQEEIVKVKFGETYFDFSYHNEAILNTLTITSDSVPDLFGNWRFNDSNDSIKIAPRADGYMAQSYQYRDLIIPYFALYPGEGTQYVIKVSDQLLELSNGSVRIVLSMN